MAQRHEISGMEAQQAGDRLAQALFETSLFAGPAQPGTFATAEADWRFTVCQKSSESDPATHHALLADLHGDNALNLAIASLKHRFLTLAEAHLANQHCGPMGFDVGCALADFLIHYCGLPGLQPPREAADGREQQLTAVQKLWNQFAARFLALAESRVQDAVLAYPGYAGIFLAQVWRDAIGYCGSELIRRGAQGEDFSAIADGAMRTDCIGSAITLGRTLVLAADHVADADALIARIRQAG